MSRCLGDESLAAYLDGELSAEQRQRAEEHLGACAACALLLAGAVRTRTLLSPLSPAPGALRLGSAAARAASLLLSSLIGPAIPRQPPR
jgi:anti-sigma factor RsiW